MSRVQCLGLQIGGNGPANAMYTTGRKICHVQLALLTNTEQYMMAGGGGITAFYLELQPYEY